MKLNKLIYGAAMAATLLVSSTGCRKSQFNINQNVNSVTDSTVTYDVVLPAALNTTGAIVGTSWGTIQNWMGYWARSGSYAPNVTEETYDVTTSFGNGIWNSCYDNNYDYQIVQVKASTAGATFYEGIARIMKSHNFMILVDVYGNIPYSQALKGGGNPTPAYDLGINVYKDLFRQLDTGINLIKNAVVTTSNANKGIATHDIIFQGNKAKWVRFANTLKLRLMIHAYAVTGIDKADEMSRITAEGSGFLGAGEDVMIQPGYLADKPNPFYNTYYKTVAGVQTGSNNYYRANAWGLEYYKYNADPRRTRFYEAGQGGLIGVAYGLPPITDNASAVLAGIGPGLYKTNTSSQAIMTAAESFFLQAEARHRGFISSGSTVATLTNSGIVESFRYIGAGDPSAYIAGNAGYPDVDVTAVSNSPGSPAGTPPVGGLYTIISQKWFALNALNTLEVWTDYRRLGYNEVVATSPVNDRFVYGQGVGYTPGPTISVAPQNTATRIPVRYLYPQSEYNYNPVNVGTQGTIDRYTKIFWDLN